MSEKLYIKKQVEFPRYKVYFYLKNSETAKQYSASCLASVRAQWRLLDLYYIDNVLILDGPIAGNDGYVSDVQKAKVDEVADKLKNTIENDVPEFKCKMNRIIQSYQKIENLDFGMADVLDMALRGETKSRFMKDWHLQIFAKILRLVFEDRTYSSVDEIDKRVNDIFDDWNLIVSIKKEVEAN